MANLSQPAAHRHRGLAAMLAALSAVGPFSIDAYLPSMPEIGRTFGASPLLVQQTLTAYLAPFALMTLWHGAISDALGRRRVTLVALALFLLASAGCALAWSIESLLTFRVLQGMTAGAGMVIGRAIVRDVLDGAEAQRLMSQVTLVFAVAPAVAPVLGGWLHVWFGWRAVFVFLVLFAGGVWLLCWRALPETLAREQRQPLNIGYLLGAYNRVLRAGPFMALSFAITFNFAAIFIYIVSAPEFLINQLHVGETGFLWLFGPATAGIVSGAWLSGRSAGRISRRQTVWWGYGIMIAAAGGNLLLNLLRPPGLPWSVLPIFVYVAGSALAMPSLALMALDLFPEQRGLASSCQSFVQTAGNALATAVVAPLVWTSSLTLALGEGVLLALGLAAFLIYLRVARSAPRG
ncbi:MAG: multidrug effflux MFS transporter [Opitutaceae bacterium]|nr:multidrug effflux MFS transporter [Opitutaceae bacterium]